MKEKQARFFLLLPPPPPPPLPPPPPPPPQQLELAHFSLFKARESESGERRREEEKGRGDKEKEQRKGGRGRRWEVKKKRINGEWKENVIMGRRGGKEEKGQRKGVKEIRKMEENRGNKREKEETHDKEEERKGTRERKRRRIGRRKRRKRRKDEEEEEEKENRKRKRRKIEKEDRRGGMGRVTKEEEGRREEKGVNEKIGRIGDEGGIGEGRGAGTKEEMEEGERMKERKGVNEDIKRKGELGGLETRGIGKEKEIKERKGANKGIRVTEETKDGERERKEEEKEKGKGVGKVAMRVTGGVLLTKLLLVGVLVAVVGVQEASPYRYAKNPPAKPAHNNSITLGIMYPKSIFRKKNYEKAIQDAMSSLSKLDLKFMKTFSVVNTISMEINPSPTSILNSLCEEFLPMNVSAIIFLSCSETYGRSTASAQYFLQLAGYLGIPVIAWNADNSGLEQAAQTGLRIQLAPSVHHQAAAMLSILVRYQWHSLSIVTSQIAGHTDFVQAVRDQVASHQEQHRAKFVIIDTIVIDDVKKSLIRLKNSEARIVLLYSTKEEASAIMGQAKKLGLVDKDYMWIVTQSVVGDKLSKELPVGMLGVHFDTSMESLTSSILTAVEVFAYAIEEFVNQTRFRNGDLNPRLSCNDHRNSKWALGSTFYRHLREVTIPKEPTSISFNNDGTRKDVELKIVNLRDSTTNAKVWEEIGVWRSWESEGLSVNDIVWPGNGHVPPQGVPEKFELKIVFLEEPPYINLAPADPVTHQCSANSGVPCRVPPSPEERAAGNTTTQTMCCSGFCIDLLEKFAADLGFTYELFRVEDGKWGTMDKDHRWNGLIGELLRRDGIGAEMALTSLKINKERESVVDFTVPFLESGIAIVVAKRTGIISPTAFLEPFDTASWMLVAFVAIQVAALTIFVFEWLSPDGYNMRMGQIEMAPPRDHKFSLFRTYWLVWAVLFQAAVHVDCPRGFTARFMANMWAMFAVVFLAIYTANLAAFMITREEFHDFSGLNDTRLQYPSTVSPAYKFGTVEETNSAMVLKRHQPHMYHYMVRHGYNRPAVTEGVRSIKKNELDAFIYDATVLDYLVGQDDDCQILTVGSWYSMSGYGLAFPRGSKYLPLFNKKLMTYKDNGEIERLQRFWMTGTCKPMKQQRRASEPLAIEQFLSAYLLLGIGMVLAVVLLGLEHIYFKYVRKHLAKKDSGGCCALVSLSMGKSLTFRGAVYEATNKLRRHRCRDPLCDTHIWKVKHELDMARVTIRHLEKQLEANGHKPTHKKHQQHIQSGVSGAPLLGCCWSSPVEEHTWVRPAALPVTSSQQHLLQSSQGAQGATPGEGTAIQAGGGAAAGTGGGLYRRHNSGTLYMETVLSEPGGGELPDEEMVQPLHPQLPLPQLPLQAAPSPLLPQTVLPTTPRKRSFETRSPDSPLAGLLRCQHQLK